MDKNQEKEYVEGHRAWNKCGCELCYHTWASKAVGKLAELRQESILLEEKRSRRTFFERLFNL